ncbi:hypothetical protein T484DRAFT_1805422 [Baffinella frigidus]|nr:hypothetical protein T484DRAFT_1805422 [Cryptophyta sp. CCMP2293]
MRRVFQPGRSCLVLFPPGCGKSSLLKFISSCVFQPGRFCLVLGPPGCGKSSLLKFISSRADASLVSRTTDYS